MHCGDERAGWKGLIIAGLCFISPAVLITAWVARACQRYGNLPEVQFFIYGIKPANCGDRCPYAFLWKKAVLAYHITEGHYNEVPLAGLKQKQ